jgi:hypothetical protein
LYRFPSRHRDRPRTIGQVIPLFEQLAMPAQDGVLVALHSRSGLIERLTIVDRGKDVWLLCLRERQAGQHC